MKRPEARPLSLDEQDELAQLCAGALVLLPSSEDVGGDEANDPLLMARFVGVLVEAVRQGHELPYVIDDAELALRLGALWGDELRRVVGWHWAMLRYDNGLEALAVVEPERRLCVLPVHFVARVMGDTGVVNSIEGLFSSVAEGRELPITEPDSYVVLG